MRKFSISLVIVSILLSTGCGKGNQVNGNSTRTAYRSVKHLKNRLPVEQRIAFEASFWSIRDAYAGDDEFLDQVGGKTPQEVIEQGKKIFQERKASGVAEYRQYANWEDMINKFSEQRSEQGKNIKRDPRDDHSVIYKL